MLVAAQDDRASWQAQHAVVPTMNAQVNLPSSFAAQGLVVAQAMQQNNAGVSGDATLVVESSSDEDLAAANRAVSSSTTQNVSPGLLLSLPGPGDPMLGHSTGNGARGAGSHSGWTGSAHDARHGMLDLSAMD